VLCPVLCAVYSVGVWHAGLLSMGFNASTVPVKQWKRAMGLMGPVNRAAIQVGAVPHGPVNRAAIQVGAVPHGPVNRAAVQVGAVQCEGVY
jgi:hypothetical protein